MSMPFIHYESKIKLLYLFRVQVSLCEVKGVTTNGGGVEVK